MEYDITQKISYTWKSNCSLPYESKWSKMVKFCFLNGISWSVFKKSKNMRDLVENEVYKNIHIPYEILKNKEEKHRYCPCCMKYGYHSDIHQLSVLDTCFLHPDTKLIKIEDESICYSGTYSFYNVRVEDLINNDAQYILIQEFYKNQIKHSPVYTTILFGEDLYYGKDTYNLSTKQVIRKFFFLQKDIELKQTKLLGSTNLKDINKANKLISERVVRTIALDKYIEEKFIEEGSNLEEYVEQYKFTIMNRNSEIPYCMRDDTLGWVFYAFILEVIDEYFCNKMEFCKVANKVKIDTTSKDIYSEELYKYAIIVALFAITGTDVPFAFQCNDSSIWTRGNNKCKYTINIAYDIRSFIVLNNHHTITFAMQYIVDVIIRDCFWYIVNDINGRVLNNILELDFNKILQKNIIRAPQYVIIIYEDKCEIYCCRSDA